MIIRDMHCQHAVVLEMPEMDLEGFPCKQVHGDRTAGEGIEEIAAADGLIAAEGRTWRKFSDM